MRQTCLLIITAIAGMAFQLAAQAPASAVLQSGNVKAVVNSNGALFWDFSNGQFIAPYASGQNEVSLLKASGIWLSGLDPGGNIRLAAQLYESNGDFAPGLITGNDVIAFNKIWRITAAEVAQHVADWEDNQVIDNPLPNVFSWPARGNPFFDQYNTGITLPNTSQGLAGFWDRDGDNVYNPAAGDFPVLEVRGCEQAVVPHEMLWFSFHDYTLHNQTQAASLNMEVHALVFTFNCTANSVLNDAIFVRYKIINRASEELMGARFGVFADFDIGAPNDDYVGCDPERQLIFGYNADPVDNLYANPPAMAIDMLRGPLNEQLEEVPLSNMMPFTNGSGPQGMPNIPIQYYYLMNGYWLDGAPAPNNGFLYPGDPNDPAADSEVTAGNTPGERRVIASSAPFELLPGAVNELILGYYFTQMPGADAFQNVAAMYDRADQVQDWFDHCFNDPENNCALVVNVKESLSKPQKLVLSPNPAMHNVVLQLEAVEESLQVAVFDVSGRQVMTAELAGMNPEINVSALKPGIYWVRAITGNGRVLAGRLAVSR